MVVLTGPNSETGLASFISDTVSNSSTEHEYRALRVIIHNVLFLWHKSLIVDDVEVNQFVRNNLNPLVATNEINLTSHVVQLIMFLPESSLFIDVEEKN
jgi:hypothetical protein